MKKVIIICAVVIFALSVPAGAVTINYTVSGWGPNQYPASITPPANAPWGVNGYPGDTLELVTYTGTLDLTPGTYNLKINTLKWSIDYTYGGTETQWDYPDHWSDLSFNINAARGMSIGTAAGSLSQTALLENQWANDFLTIYEGATSSFTVGGFQVDVTPLGLNQFGGTNFSGDNPWVQPEQDIIARFDVVPEPPPTEVWVDDDYCEACSNDGHTWGYDAFAVIQQGINAVADSGTVNVAEGRYDSNETFPISINKTFRLLGPQANVDPRPIKCGGRTGSEAIIDANETTDAVIQISASDVEINGFTITGGKKDMVEENGSADNLLFQYNILYDDLSSAGDEAIQIMYSNGVIIQYNYAYNIVQDAFNLSASSNGVVRYNEAHDIYSENAAIYCYETNNIDIIGNLVYRVYNNDIIKLGDDGDGSTGGIVKDNVVYDGVQDGITIYATGVTVQANTIYNCDSENGALYLDYADNTTIRGNKIYNNDAIGLLIDHSSNVTVEENRIYDNNDTNDTKYPGTAGIWLTSDSNAATITINDNIIYGNAEFGLRNDDDANVNAENNCWGDPNGPYHPVTNPDAVGDAVSDRVDFQPWLLACCGDPDHPYPVGDINQDCRVNFYDFAVFASAWLNNRCDENWNPNCNLELSDDVIDTMDLGVLADHWLECTME